MSGTLANVGLANTGTGLTGDTITKLRKSDEKAQIAPIEKRIEEDTQKKESLEQLITIIDQAKDFSSELKDEMLYLKRSANVNGEGVSATVEDGVDPQDITLKVKQLAQEHIIQSDAFDSKTASVADANTEITIKLGEKEHVIPIKEGTQLRDMVYEINSKTNGEVKASILQTGKDEFRLVMATASTGVDNKIELIQGTNAGEREEEVDVRLPLPRKRDPETGELLIDPDTGKPYPLEYEEKTFTEEIEYDGVKPLKNFYNEVQEPQDALFTFNGADIVRASNTIDDMVTGLTINLEQVTDENKRVTINVEQDKKQITEQIAGFVEAYNVLAANIDEMTKFDPDAEEVGIFLGENTINSIRTNLNRLITQPDKDGNSLAQMGVTFNQDGSMEFDQAAFEQALNSDPEGIKEFFQGKNESINGKDMSDQGLFNKITDFFDDLVNSSNGSITGFSKTLDKQIKRSNEEKETAMKRLDSRYETMANEFAAADSSINKLKKSFDSVDMQIKQSQASK